MTHFQTNSRRRGHVIKEVIGDKLSIDSASVTQPSKLMRLGPSYQYVYTPESHTGSKARAAVALDCEMGTSKSGETEVIRLTAVDYFTSEILVNSLVYPDKPMGNYHTRFSGVSRSQMERARSKGKCLLGRKAARDEIWKFVDPTTILVGHSANHDLSAMRWIHLNVVDTMLTDLLIVQNERKRAKEMKAQKLDESCIDSIFTSSTGHCSMNGKSRKESSEKSSKKHKRKVGSASGLSLKSLASTRLDRNIQKGGIGHDSLEDALATRDLAHWNIINRGFGPISNI